MIINIKDLNNIISINLIPALYFHKNDPPPYVIVYSEQKMHRFLKKFSKSFFLELNLLLRCLSFIRLF